MSTEFLIIDRFEGDLAVCESDGGRVHVSREFLPGAAKEGDVIRFEAGRYIIDYEKTALKRRKNAQKLTELLNKQTKK
jgi:hypothetical protein